MLSLNRWPPGVEYWTQAMLSSSETTLTLAIFMSKHHAPIGLVRDGAFHADQAFHDNGADPGPHRSDIDPGSGKPPPQVGERRLRSARFGSLGVVQGTISGCTLFVEALDAEHDSMEERHAGRTHDRGGGGGGGGGGARLLVRCLRETPSHSLDQHRRACLFNARDIPSQSLTHSLHFLSLSCSIIYTRVEVFSPPSVEFFHELCTNRRLLPRRACVDLFHELRTSRLFLLRRRLICPMIHARLYAFYSDVG